MPEYELRVADVAWISVERLRDINIEGHFEGAPDLVVEVLSPSNTFANIDGAEICDGWSIRTGGR